MQQIFYIRKSRN